jgi:hypothetical protein
LGVTEVFVIELDFHFVDKELKIIPELEKVEEKQLLTKKW